MEKESFIFYRSFWEALDGLSDNDKLAILEAIIEKGLNDEDKELKGIQKNLFALIKPQLEANNKKYIDGLKGGRPKKTTGFEKEKPLVINQKTTGFETKKPNDNDNVNVNVNDNETVNETVNDIKEKEKEKNDYALFIDYDFTKKTYDDGIKNKVFNFTNFDDFWIYYKDKGVLKSKLHNLMIRWDIRWNEEQKKKANGEKDRPRTKEELKWLYGVI